jgi:hypothetical protein
VPARSAGQLHFQIGQRFAPTLDELAQHGLRGAFAVRSIQRPAQPRQRVEADTRLEGSPHEAQPLQGGSSNSRSRLGCTPPAAAIRAAGSRARYARSPRHQGPAGTPCRRSSNTSFPHPAQQESCFTSLLKVCAASFNPSTIVR